MTRSRINVLVLLLILHTQSSYSAPACPSTDPVDPSKNPALVVTDRAILTEEAFGFSKTVGALLDSESAENTPTNRKAYVNSLLHSIPIDDTIIVHKESSLWIRINGIGKRFEATDLLNTQAELGLIPIGVFNRLDLTPDPATYCGEYRIVYSLNKTSEAGDRLFLIFEAALPNPSGDLKDCVPVAKYWQELNTLSRKEQQIRLVAFFYDGWDSDLDGIVDIEPILKHENFGLANERGQVRGNIKLDDGSWQLYEWHASFSVNEGQPIFNMEPVEQTPLIELYRQLPGEPPFTPLDVERIRFRLSFLAKEFQKLFQPEITAILNGSSLTASEIINGISSKTDLRFDDYQSIMPKSEDPDQHGTPSSRDHKQFRTLLKANINLVNLALANNYTVDHALNRASAMSCGGCHFFARDKEIAPGIVWPGGRDFVHIKENGELSFSLKQCFLPWRRTILEKFIAENEISVVPERQVVLLLPIYQHLQYLKTQFKSASNDKIRSEYLAEINFVLNTLRNLDRDRPGAFVASRRIH